MVVTLGTYYGWVRGRTDESRGQAPAGAPSDRLAEDTTAPQTSRQPLPLADSYGRVARDLRLSLTDRCNLRCTYCMPAEGLKWLPSSTTLTTDELVRLVRIGVDLLGITEVRLTGGEPLLRPDLAQIIQAISALDARPEISLTTNGIGLDGRIEELRAAGLDRINVSLDTLDRERFRRMTKRDRLDDVLAGLNAADALGMQPIKVNAVLLRGINEDEAVGLLRFCLERGYELRFIEQMPLDPMHGWSREQMVTQAEILAQLQREWTLGADSVPRGSAPAQRWLIDGGPATVAVIASVTEPFCSACDRVRLTADGQVRSCLFSRTETDLRTMLRAGATDAELAQAWRGGFYGKPASHGINSTDFQQPARPMSAIGG